MNRRRTEELVLCILDALHGKACRILRYASGTAASPAETEIAVLTPYRISEDEEQRLSDAVFRFNAAHGESVSVVDVDVRSFEERRDGTPFYREIGRGVTLWP